MPKDTKVTSRFLEVVLRFSHSDLAQMAAMSRPHVSVTMNKLRIRGLIDYKQNHPLVVNVSALENYLTGDQLN